LKITVATASDFSFDLTNNDETTEKVFLVDDDGTMHLVKVHIDKQLHDADGDGTPDMMNGKFCLSIVEPNGALILFSGKEIKVSQVHGVTVESVNDGSVDLYDWVNEKCNVMIPTLINKSKTISAWANLGQ